jgi:putative ABC transport system permease protein
MRGIRNALALTLAAIRSIPQRLGASLVTVISITTVMGVLVSMLALGQGVEALAQTAAHPDRAQILASGAQSSMVSALPRSVVPSLLDKPGIKRDAEGKPIAMGGFLTIIDAVTRQNQRESVGVFSVGPQWRKIYPEVHIVEGRYFQPGLRELIVADRIRARFKGLDIGDEVRMQGSYWKVVGVFRAGSSFFDNATLADADTVLAAFPQSPYTGVYLVLESPAAFNTLKKALADDPTLSVDLKTEAEANENAVKNIRGVLDFVSYFIGSLMALGATCGALASLYAAVDARRVEIATLRAIGFGPTPVVVSVLAEGMCLAIPAALLGAGIAAYLFNGQLVATGGVNFPMTVTPQLVVISICWSLAIALVGGLLPSIRAARLPVATALRET